MQARAFIRRAALVFIVCAVIGGMLAPAGASAKDHTPGVLPPHSNPHGASYAEWGGRWWVWALSKPLEVNPVMDRTGELCAQGQSGSVWFLAGTFINNPPEILTRNCTIPPGKALFIPLYNMPWITFYSDPARCAAKGYPSLEACALDELKFGDSPEEHPDWGMEPNLEAFAKVGGLQLIVDGKPVDLAFSNAITSPYRVQSIGFRWPLPLDNMFGLDETYCPRVGDMIECYPAYGDGVYVMLAPLSAGTHTLRILVPGALDVTYNLIIQSKNGKKQAAVEDAEHRVFVPFVSTEP